MYDCNSQSQKICLIVSSAVLQNLRSGLSPLSILYSWQLTSACTVIKFTTVNSLPMKQQQSFCSLIRLFLADKPLDLFEAHRLCPLLCFFSSHIRELFLIGQLVIRTASSDPIIGYPVPSLATLSAISLLLKSLCPGIQSSSRARSSARLFGLFQYSRVSCNSTSELCNAVKTALLSILIYTLPMPPSCNASEKNCNVCHLNLKYSSVQAQKDKCTLARSPTKHYCSFQNTIRRYFSLPDYQWTYKSPIILYWVSYSYISYQKGIFEESCPGASSAIFLI